MAKKKKSPAPRAGPATNIRPAGAHRQLKDEPRARIKEEIKRFTDDERDEPPSLS